MTPPTRPPLNPQPLFGSHLSVAGGLENALLHAHRLGMNCVQIFTKNQRQWSAPPLSPDQIATWRDHRKSTSITTVVSHDSYLINLASPNDQTRDKSIHLFIDELQRCQALDIPFLVTHPGAHTGCGESTGLTRVALALDQIHQSLPDCTTITCLEITAGQGTSLGYTFNHLRSIIDQVAQPHRLAVCLDTAHALAAGYDLTSSSGARSVLDELDQTLGLDRVRVVHVNDSKVPRGKRVDRHEHIGQGHVSLDAIAVICNQFRNVPKILETPKDTADDGRDWDQINLEILQGLMT